MKMSDIIKEDWSPLDINLGNMNAYHVLTQVMQHCEIQPNKKQCAMYKKQWETFPREEKQTAIDMVKKDKADMDFKADVTNTMIKAQGDSNSKSSRPSYKWTNPGAF
jgi:hypothetical protein